MFELKSIFEILFKFDLVYIWIGFENKIEKENSLFLYLGPKAHPGLSLSPALLHCLPRSAFAPGGPSRSPSLAHRTRRPNLAPLLSFGPVQ